MYLAKVFYRYNSYMKLNQKIIKFLDDNSVDYSLIEHEPVVTSIEAARVRGSNLAEGAKAMLFWAYPTSEKFDRYPIQLVINGDKRVSKEKVIQELELVKVKMLSADDVEKISSVKPGAVPPFSNLFKPSVDIYLAQSFLLNKNMEFNVGLHSQSIRMKTEDWIKVVNPTIVDITEE